jgi:hypothetical protein
MSDAADAVDRRCVRGIDVTVYCSVAGFSDRPACYKIAAEWKAGDLSGLKTFGFANDDCLEVAFRQAVRAVEAVRYAEGEALGPMGIYRLVPNLPDAQLERLVELEAATRRRLQ